MKYKILARANPRVLNLEICEDIWQGAEFSAAEIRRRIANADVDLINVRINSMGGDVDEGLDIYHSLVSHPARVEVMITGIAASMASAIACAGDYVRMSETAQYMIHNPWTAAVGDANELSQAAEVLKQRQEGLAKIYAARSAKPFEQIIDMMDRETYLGALEAKDLGFVDEIVPVKASARELASLPIEKTRAPEAFKQLVIFAKGQLKKMDPQILALLNLKDDATLDDVMNAIKALRQTAAPPVENTEPEVKEPEVTPEAVPDNPDNEEMLIAALGRLGPNVQAAVLAWRDKAARAPVVTNAEHAALVAKLPSNLRGWGAKQSVAAIKGYLARVGETPEHGDTEPRRDPPALPKDELTEAEAAYAKAAGLTKVQMLARRIK